LVFGSQGIPGRQVAIGPPSLDVVGRGRTPWEALFAAKVVEVKAINVKTTANEYFFMVFSPR
jgi:hypothetical protein